MEKVNEERIKDLKSIIKDKGDCSNVENVCCDNCPVYKRCPSSKSERYKEAKRKLKELENESNPVIQKG